MKAKKPHEFGQYIRSKRVEADVSLRAAAKVLGISAVYLGEVERGVRQPLKKEHWKDLVRAVPTIEIDTLERLTAKARPLQLDLRDTPPNYQDLALALSRRIQDRSIAKSEIDKIMSILGKSDE